MANKVGKLIKEARTAAGFTQEQLAKKAKQGLTAADVSKAERGEKELTGEQLKSIAKITGVTQKSLLEAAASSSYKSSSAAKTSAKTSGSTSSSSITMKLSAAEKKLVEYYRKADASAKKQATELLKSSAEDDGGLLGSLLGGSGSTIKNSLLNAAKEYLKDTMK